MEDLVSVIVVTYNSAKDIIDTLDSILNQTYSHIQLIVSDDCGQDNTLDIVNNWVESVKENADTANRFESIVITRTPHNVGVSDNCNHGLKHAHGKWIKLIGGDDKLRPNCIEEFVNHASESEDKVFLCCLEAFEDVSGERKAYDLSSKWQLANAGLQERYMIQGLDHWFPLGPSLFFDRETLLKVGGFDSQYPMIEDLPICLKMLKNGFRLNVIYKTLVDYRVHFGSITRGNSRFCDSLYGARDNYLIPAARRHNMWHYWYHLNVQSAIRKHKYPKAILYALSGMDILNWKRKFSKS